MRAKNPNKPIYVEKQFKGGTHPETFMVGDAVIHGSRGVDGKLRHNRGFFEYGDQGKIITLFYYEKGFGSVDWWAGVEVTSGNFAGQGMQVYLREITHADEADLPPCRTCGECPYTRRSK